MIERQIFITDKCQQNCKYCQVPKGDWVISIQELVTIIRKIISQSGIDEPIAIHLFGGEPLLCMPLLTDLFENYTFPENIQFFLATNGISLDKEIYDFLKKHKVNILLSLDGDEEINNLNRGNFQKIYSQLREVIGDEKIYGVQATFAANSIDRFEEAFKFLITLPVEHFCFNINKMDSYSNEQVKQIKEILDSLAKDPIFKKKIADPARRYDLFEDFPSFETSEEVITSQGIHISNRIFLLSGLQEDTKCDSFIGNNCKSCPLKEKCQPNGAKNPAQINNGMCIDLILHYYQPYIAEIATNPIPIFQTKSERIAILKEAKTDSYLNILKSMAELNKLAASKMQSLNKNSHILSLSSKCVFEENGMIYRIEAPYAIRLRVAFAKKAKEEGFDIFLPERIAERNSLFYLSVQEKVDLIDFQTEEEIFETICTEYGFNQDRFKNFINKYGLLFLGEGPSAGRDQTGKIKIFDYIINAIVTDEEEIEC